MADANDNVAVQEAPRKRGAFGVLVVATALLAGGAGAATPWLLNTHNASPQSSATTPSPEPLTPDRTAFVHFGELTVNLNEGRLNRYLRIKLVLQVDKAQVDAVTAAVERKRLPLRSWLLSHLSDKDQNEIRGAAGQNMLRREIRERFNALLFPDGHDRIFDVLFEEFNVQ